MTTESTEAQAPTPEPSELRNLLERAKPHASSHALVYGHRGIIGELIDALEARALSPSPDTRMGEEWGHPLIKRAWEEIYNLEPAVDHISRKRKIDRKDALSVIDRLRRAISTRLAASSSEGGDTLRSALEAAVRDLEATYEAAKSGKLIETSIGQFGRLSRMKAVLASPAMPEVETIPNALEAAFAAMPETEVEQVTQGKLHEACEGALQWMEQLADRFEGEWPNTSAHCRIHVNTLRAALSTSAGEKGGGIAQMQRALVDHNDALRSAASVAGRDGKDTNWLTVRGHIHWILAEHHEITNEARAALGSVQESGE